MKKVGCFLILLILIGLYILGSFFSEEDNTSVDTIITTPQDINRDAKEMDWFATPEAQNLKVGDFIIVTGHPSGYVGAAEEPFGDELFPTFKLVYGEPRHYIFIARSELPNQEEIGYVYVTSNIDFGKIQSVREYNDMRQENMENDDWHKKGGLTMIVQIKSIDYDLFNKEIGNKYFIKAIYIPGDMLRY